MGLKMAVKKSKVSKGKYAVELERLRELNAINEVLKKSDIENAALTNTSKDSETVNDNVLDNMLDQLNVNKNSGRDLSIVESMAGQKVSRPSARKKPARSAGGRKKVLMVKRRPQKMKMQKVRKASKKKKR